MFWNDKGADTNGSPIGVRWLIRADMDQVLKIESDSFASPWSEEDFLHCLRQRNCIGMVAEQDKEILGFMVYELHKPKMRLLNIAVHPEYLLRGIGRLMVERLKMKLSQQRRKMIEVMAHEENLDAHLFFQRLGFRAVTIQRNPYERGDGDGYLFRFRLDCGPDELDEEQFAPEWNPRNRLAGYFQQTKGA